LIPEASLPLMIVICWWYGNDDVSRFLFESGVELSASNLIYDRLTTAPDLNL